MTTKLGVHIVIDEFTIGRALLTGHPRLLCNVLRGRNEDVKGAVLKDVHLGKITGSVWEGYTEWTAE